MDINEFKSLSKRRGRVNVYLEFVKGLTENTPVEVALPEGKSIASVRSGIVSAGKTLDRKIATVVNPADGKFYVAWLTD